MATPVSLRAGLARLFVGFAPFGAVVAANGANGSSRPFGKAAITAAGVGRAVKRGSFAGGWSKGGRGAPMKLFEIGGATAQPATAAAVTEIRKDRGQMRFKCCQPSVQLNRESDQDLPAIPY